MSTKTPTAKSKPVDDEIKIDLDNDPDLKTAIEAEQMKMKAKFNGGLLTKFSETTRLLANAKKLFKADILDLGPFTQPDNPHKWKIKVAYETEIKRLEDILTTIRVEAYKLKISGVPATK